MSQFTPDRDSLVALDALLRIRESSGYRVESSPMNNGSRPTYISIGSSPQTPLPAAAHPSPSFSGLASNLLQSRAFVLPQVRCSPFPSTTVQQFAVAQAALNRHRQSTLERVMEEATAAEGQRTSSPGGKLKASGITTSTSTKRTVSVRKEKVEAALRSKPQRGRKRDDLSDKERLELTRTRNREHAKSTR